MYNNPYTQGGQTWHNNLQNNQRQEVGIDLKQIYVYFLNHPFCKYKNLQYPVFVHFYTEWINKKYN